MNGLTSSALYGSTGQYEFKWKRVAMGLTTVYIIILGGHSLNHDHTSWMAFEEIVDKGNEHDDSSWRGDERKSG